LEKKKNECDGYALTLDNGGAPQRLCIEVEGFYAPPKAAYVKLGQSRLEELERELERLKKKVA
jgi:hypothetical protein